ncbi:MAG: hypothetical protein GC171_07375 [Terrimonas sp.]|nr:hypothetical protein [Terrimonas sp.]
MNTDNHLTIVRQVVEQGFGKGDMRVIDNLISDDCVEHQFAMKGGKEGLKKAILSLEAAFSQRNYQLVQYAVTGDRVWTQYIATGVHTGAFLGHPASGKKFMIDVIDIAKIEKGKICEHWGIPDRFALLYQLGLIEP